MKVKKGKERDQKERKDQKEIGLNNVREDGREEVRDEQIAGQILMDKCLKC